MRVCDVEGCESKHYARGYCAKHYDRWKRYGDATVEGPGRGNHPRKFRKCMVASCDRKHRANGFCNTHNRQFDRNGLLGLREIRPKGPWAYEGEEEYEDD